MKNIWYPFLFATISIIVVFLLWDGIEIYFTDKLNTLAKHQSQYAIVSFFILASDIILPVPSSIVMYFNGYVLGVFEGAFISLASLLRD